MSKNITPSQLLGEIGEAAVRLRFLTMGFQFDGRSRLEAGVDGIAEVMDRGRPLARMIAVQVKATDSGRYTSETDAGFSYLMRPEDLDYWRGSNLPIIIVLYRKSDDTFFWKEVGNQIKDEERRLQFDKAQDVLDVNAVERLAALTVPKAGFGYYVPPIGGGEEALVNILPVTLPSEVFVSSTPHTPKKAAAILLDGDAPRFDWAIKGGTFWSFSDPRETVCRDIVDLDQVEAIDTSSLAFHEDQDEQNNFAFLLRKTLDHQVRNELRWNKERKLFYVRALAENTTRTFAYEASKKRTSTDVVNAVMNKTDKTKVDFVRHHAFVPRFELLYDQWYLVINPTYFFTTNGFIPHSYPAALLAGKKRMDNSASLRGQVVMWHRFLSQADRDESNLFGQASTEPRLRFGEPPVVALATRVPEDVWGSQKKAASEPDDGQERMFA
ncbi:DUF4365 domain-containing protein [Rhodoplanes sp. Z2-YC6860]|uniref:DUF4365 domain-containing protein n=1 Tax=Rhodoplanes sp. Z2-YC6860 TaxID=674703 RepID=UPI00078BC828|nr:DUF4365 domain-containing protein [Rhodoplanes sp. Z2-YC6860]AMN40485.1 hypothetical protein RHPLAN_20410 [Rhodoplanes sp. Z2-YC6860]